MGPSEDGSPRWGYPLRGSERPNTNSFFNHLNHECTIQKVQKSVFNLLRKCNFRKVSGQKYVLFGLNLKSWLTFHLPCADGVVIIAISLFPEVPCSIPERGKKRSFLWMRLFLHAVHLLRFLRGSDPLSSGFRSLSGDNLALASHPRMGESHNLPFCFEAKADGISIVSTVTSPSKPSLARSSNAESFQFSLQFRWNLAF